VKVKERNLNLYIMASVDIKIQTEDHLIKSTQKFKEFSRKNNFDFLVVGSMALKVCGLPIKEVPHDLDIEVSYKDEEDKVRLTKLFSALSDAYGNYYYKTEEYRIEGVSSKPFIFEFNGTLVNVWLVNSFTHQYVWLDYVKYATIYSVLKAKMTYGRPKDFRSLSYIISELNKLGL
jgi:hypothetical protein